MCTNEMYIKQLFPRAYGGGGLRIGNISTDPCNIPPIDVKTIGTDDLGRVNLPFAEEVSGDKAIQAIRIIKDSKINFVEFTLY